MECLQCGKSVYGRSDKKFCSADCRNEFNNLRYKEEKKAVIEINRILMRNRKILKQLNPEGKMVISSDLLLKSGFDLEYYTNSYTTKSGREYRYCYDYGYYYDEEKDSYLLVKRLEF